MPDDFSDNPHASGTSGEAGPTQEFKAGEAPPAKRVPLVREIVLHPTPPPLPGEPRPVSQSPAQEGPGEFTRIFQALQPPSVSPVPAPPPVTHPPEDTAGKSSGEPSPQDAASFTQLLNSILRPGAKNPPAPPPLAQDPVPAAVLPLEQNATRSAANVDRDSEVTRIFATSHPQPPTPAPTASLLQRYLPLLVLLNATLVVILGILVFLFLRHH